MKRSALLALLMIATALVARGLGWRLPASLLFPVFLIADSLLQSAPPGETMRPWPQRIVGSIVIATVSGAVLWMIERWDA